MSFDSTSAARTSNNVMRHAYRTLSDVEKQQMLEIKDSGQAFYELLERLTDAPESREIAIAKTKVEEAVMWAVKHITG